MVSVGQLDYNQRYWNIVPHRLVWRLLSTTPTSNEAFLDRTGLLNGSMIPVLNSQEVVSESMVGVGTRRTLHECGGANKDELRSKVEPKGS